MGDKIKKADAFIGDEAYEKWEKIKNKKDKDMVEFLQEHTTIDNVEEMVQAKEDNVSLIAEKHPEVVDHDTPTEQLMEQWEDSIGEMFPDEEQPKENDNDQ